MVLDNLLQLTELLSYLLKLSGSVGIKHYLAQEMVVFTEHSPGYIEMALECSAGSVLMFHYSCENEGGGNRDGERIGDGLVVFLKSVLHYVKFQLVI